MGKKIVKNILFIFRLLILESLNKSFKILVKIVNFYTLILFIFILINYYIITVQPLVEFFI